MPRLSWAVALVVLGATAIACGVGGSLRMLHDDDPERPRRP